MFMTFKIRTDFPDMGVVPKWECGACKFLCVQQWMYHTWKKKKKKNKGKKKKKSKCLQSNNYE